MSEATDAHVLAMNDDIYGSIHYAVYDPTTGAITQSGNMAPASLRHLEVVKGWKWIQTDGPVHWRTHKVDLATNTCVPKPPDPPKALTIEQQRRYAYPPIEDLADALYWYNTGDKSKMTTYMQRVAAVKAKFPKPPGSDGP